MKKDTEQVWLWAKHFAELDKLGPTRKGEDGNELGERARAHAARRGFLARSLARHADAPSQKPFMNQIACRRAALKRAAGSRQPAAQPVAPSRARAAQIASSHLILVLFLANLCKLCLVDVTHCFVCVCCLWLP